MTKPRSEVFAINALFQPKSHLVAISLIVLISGAFGQSPTTAWTKASLVSPAIKERSNDISFSRIFFVPSGQGWATFVMGEYPNQVHGVAKSNDGGDSWEFVPLRGYRWIDSVYFLDSKRGWISTNDDSATSSAVLLHTTDGGTTWTRWSSLESLRVKALLGMHFDLVGEGVAVGFVMPGQAGVVLRTNDFAKTWVFEKTTDRTLKGIVIREENTFAWGDSEILRRSGNDWQIVRPKEGILMGIDAPTADSVFAIRHYGQIFRSTDTGRTLEMVSLPTPYDDLFLGAIKFSDALFGWVAGHNGVILATSDGGKTWKSDGQMPSYFLRDIGFTEKRVFVVGDDGAIFWRNKPAATDR